jgi:predicted acyltransferase
MAQSHATQVGQSASATERLVSLDAFRGATIALMILVNTAGGFQGTYPPLLHADWHGWTPTDVVFPSFLWIVGVSLTLSLAKRASAGVPRGKLIAPILRRGAILYVLGLFLYGFPDFDLSTWRILGVLQRIAICYVAAALIYLWTGIRGQIAWIAGLLIVYTVLMTTVPVPGYGAGRFDVEGNFAHYVDRIVLGSHNYRETRTWDPEGIVSTLPAIATALLGVMAGHIFRSRRQLAERTTWLFIAGNSLLAAGLLLDAWIPITKKLWTTSFALFMAGLDFVLFAGFAWIVDGVGHRRIVRPFVILGMNAIVVYMLSELLDVILYRTGVRAWLYGSLYAPFFSPANASFLFSLTYVASMFAVASLMYRRGWFVRV